MNTSLAELLSSPEKFEGREVVIKGFIVSDREGNFFLTTRPQVRSCCLHQENKVEVIGEALMAELRAQEIRAMFKEGRLEEATTLSPNLHIFPWTVVSFAGLLCFQYYFRNFRKKNSS